MNLNRKIQVDIDATGAKSGARTATEALREVDAQARKTGGGLDVLGQGGGKAAESMSLAGTAAKAFGGVLAGISVAAFARSIFDAGVAMDSMERSFVAITGNSTAASAEMFFLRDEADRLGQSFYDLAPQFKQIAASARGTALEGEQTRKIFSAITEASTALGLSSDETSGALNALSQMISKGTVQAEELRGQLGERLPGAFQLAAQAMGVSTQELGKMLEQGQVLATDLLPKLADELHKLYGEAAETAGLESAQAAINRLSQEWTEFKTNLFDGKAFVAAIGYIRDLIAAANSFLSGPSMAERIKNAEAVRDSYREMRDNQAPDSGAWRQFEKDYQAAHKHVLELRREFTLLNEDQYRNAQLSVGTAAKASEQKTEIAKTERDRLQKILDDELLSDRQKLDRQLEQMRAAGFAAVEIEQFKAKRIAEINEKAAQAAETAARKAEAAKEKALKDAQERNALKPYQITALEQMNAGDMFFGKAAADKRGLDLLNDVYERNDELLTEFADKHREVVQGETAFKLEQIDLQAQAYRRAGADEVAVEQWAKAEKLAVSRDWQDGATRALQSYADEAGNAAKNVEDVMTMAFTGLEDVVVEFVKTGKLEFADLVTSINAEIARLAFRGLASGAYEWMGGLLSAGISAFSGGTVSSAAGSAGVAGTLSSMFSRNAKGGVYDSPGLSAYSGGVYSSPQFFAFAKGAGVFGEAGPEAIMPLKRGPDGTLGVQAGGGNSEMTALLREIAAGIKAQRGTKVVNAIGKGAIANELSGSEGEQVIFNHIRRNPSAVRRMLGLG